MSESAAPYNVSYIAAAPEELKVGDRVEVVDNEAHNFRGAGVVEYFKDQYVVVRFENETTGYSYVLAQLRKLPDTPEELKVGDRVEVIDAADNLYRKQGLVQTVPVDGRVMVEFANNVSYSVRIEKLRKLPDTISFEEKDNPLDKQVGGSHYKDMAIQPIEFSMKNGLNACQHSIIKYVCRYKQKNGKEDLLKAKHFIDLLIQMEYPE